jgi:HNH endonuclease
MVDVALCYLCGAPTSGQLDHVVPRSRGGSNDPQNLRPCCRPCNRLKGFWSLEDFEALCRHVVYDEPLPRRIVLRDTRRAPDRVRLYERIAVHMGWLRLSDIMRLPASQSERTS